MKKIILPSIVVLIIFGCLFYWYAVRPISIKKSCDSIAWKAATEGGYDADTDTYNWKYTQCLHSYGL